MASKDFSMNNLTELLLRSCLFDVVVRDRYRRGLFRVRESWSENEQSDDDSDDDVQTSDGGEVNSNTRERGDFVFTGQESLAFSG